jgi:Fic family protein
MYHFDKLPAKTPDFDFYRSISAVYSSQIEGNPLDLDSFLKIKDSGMNTQNKSYKEIQDLINAYQFAQYNVIHLKNLLKAHKIASKTLLKGSGYAGMIRDKSVGIYEQGRLVYRATSEDLVQLSKP